MSRLFLIIGLLFITTCALIPPYVYFAENQKDADRCIVEVKKHHGKIIKVIPYPNGMFEIKYKP
jgi:meiotically up-regulated gene 157 (Mug157) protein